MKWGIFDDNGIVLKICDTEEECYEWIQKMNIKYEKVIKGSAGLLMHVAWTDKGFTYVEGKGWVVDKEKFKEWDRSVHRAK